mmetsp:Transcript_19105/g.47753  ORF Transcript_19105/g.47753 Transcript_19105/m.47753 type:complete len:121 (+) Transcript_19105:193-555(+)
MTWYSIVGTGIFHKEDNGKVVNPTGIGVFVTKTGSMTKERFPDFCAHFVKNLLKNNVYCLCLPGHTSIWSQPGHGKCVSSARPPGQTALRLRGKVLDCSHTRERHRSGWQPSENSASAMN